MTSNWDPFNQNRNRKEEETHAVGQIDYPKQWEQTPGCPPCPRTRWGWQRWYISNSCSTWPADPGSCTVRGQCLHGVKDCDAYVWNSTAESMFSLPVCSTSGKNMLSRVSVHQMLFSILCKWCPPNMLPTFARSRVMTTTSDFLEWALDDGGDWMRTQISGKK